MTIESVLGDRVTGYAGVSALIGTRLYPQIAPKNVTLPCIVYQRGDPPPERFPVMGGADVGIVKATFAFDCYAATYLTARALADQVRQALQRWSTTTGTTVEDVFVIDESDGVTEEQIAVAAGSDSIFTHRATIEFRVTYRE
ncbi:MAG: DUF3168 domain-containing protein [Betaproteobacteria bacterium]|nr:DUF3168 domain-containing protein [Betaproteobacteria bacterium]